jgi:hypothetical protein
MDLCSWFGLNDEANKTQIETKRKMSQKDGFVLVVCGLYDYANKK